MYLYGYRYGNICCKEQVSVTICCIGKLSVTFWYRSGSADHYCRERYCMLLYSTTKPTLNVFECICMGTGMVIFVVRNKYTLLFVVQDEYGVEQPDPVPGPALSSQQ
jgi:hypothetical protein